MIAAVSNSGGVPPVGVPGFPSKTIHTRAGRPCPLFSAKRWGFLPLFLLLAFTLATHAQVQVDVSLKRSLYLRYEPILLTVTITNMTGGELSLSDSGAQKWFGLQIETLDGRPIPSVGGEYANQPLELGPQQKISRTVNLTPIFPISEFGSYRVRATVFARQTNRFFTSPALNFEITEGRLMWQKTVGVPDGSPGAGTSRTVTLLAHRLPQSSYLYVRIEDSHSGTVFCTHQLGRFLTFGSPNVLLDRQNKVHILQNVAPKTYTYSKIGLNGEVLERKSFNEFSTRPALRRGSDGSVLIVGGQVFDPTAPPPEQVLPSIADRPVDLPGLKQKTKPEDKRPENLLSR